MEGEAVELTTFTSVGDAYVYAPLPPATSYGHRAELWNPDKWLQEVKVKLVTAGDHCFMRMLAKDTGELFAECPLPADSTPLTTVVEPVVDSSRYFVVKVVDRESRKHAFIGVGFRDRMDASDLSAALDDYRQYLRRKSQAEQLRQEFDALQAPSAAAGSSGNCSGDGSSSSASEQQQQQQPGAEAGAGPQRDFSLKPGETLHIKLSPSLKRGGSGSSRAAAGAAAGAASIPSTSSGNAEAAPGAIPKLAPPSSTSSSSSFFRLHPPPAGSTSSEGGPAWTERQASLERAAGAQQPPPRAARAAEEDWGDFVG